MTVQSYVVADKLFRTHINRATIYYAYMSIETTVNRSSTIIAGVKNERHKKNFKRKGATGMGEPRDERRKRDDEGIPVGGAGRGGGERRLAMKSSHRNFKVSFHSFTSEKKNLNRAQAHYPSALLVSILFSLLSSISSLRVPTVFFFFFHNLIKTNFNWGRALIVSLTSSSFKKVDYSQQCAIGKRIFSEIKLHSANAR